MRHRMRWTIVGLLGAALQLTGCGQTAAPATTKAQPAKVTKIEGSDLSRLTLVDSAVKRLAIETVDVRDAAVSRTRVVGGEVVAERGQLLVKVPLSTGDVAAVDQGVSAKILPLAETADAQAVASNIAQAPASAAGQTSAPALYYALPAGGALASGQRVRVELPLQGNGATRMVIPYSAVIYDVHGTTWVYTNPEPLTFVREQVTVDYIDGDNAVLAKSLASGTRIVSVGAAELYGTEFGVGH